MERQVRQRISGAGADNADTTYDTSGRIATVSNPYRGTPNPNDKETFAYDGLNRVPICGKDFKTGQTLLKTILAPRLKARLLGLDGWFSTHILGNRDGEVLDDPESFRTKEESQLSVLEYILQPELYPQLYKGFHRNTLRCVICGARN